MDELLRELQERRDTLNIEADNQKRDRDELNDRARGWIQVRDRYNAELREFLDKANEMKQLREDYNKKVKEGKLEREHWDKAVTKLSSMNFSYKKRLKGIPLLQLERRLRALEFKQMTTVLSAEDEKELIKELSNTQALIKKGEAELLKDKEFKKLRDELINAKKELDRFVKLVSESAEKAQRAHEEMRKLFERCDKARAKADDAQVKFLEVKARADVFHQKYIEIVKEIHELGRVIEGLMQKDKIAKDVKEERSAKKEAETIFERFKKGEKLSTEDLMTLQKSGYI